jgi:hypothetical protein
MKRNLRTSIYLFAFFPLVSLANRVSAQQCDSTFSITLKGNANNPGFITSILANGDATLVPYGDTSKTIVQAFTWTDNEHNNPDFIGRALIKFDLTTATPPPPGAILTGAKLYLYAKTDAGDGVAGQPTYGSANTGLLQMVIQPWDIRNTNYNNTPATNVDDQKILPQSSSTAQNYVVDIKSFITYWMANPDKNYGMLLRMQTESNPYNSLIFEGGTGPSAKRPKIVLTYSMPAEGADQSVITGDFSSKFSLVKIDNYYIIGDSSKKVGLQAYTWTNNEHGIPLYIGRSIIKYDVSSIPANSVVLSAKMYFFADGHAGDGVSGQPTYGDANAGLLQKIVSHWSLKDITYNNQPSVTTDNEKTLAQSTNTAQNYTVNVTDFVQDWINRPDSNYGVLLRMKQEKNPYNSLLFTSSNAASNIRPKLVICYKMTLPLSMSGFQGLIQNLAATLNWATYNEVNFSHTSVEKSYDGVAFTAVGSVPAKGLASINSYQFIDYDLAAHSNKVYYRLKLVDNDGKYSFSKILLLNYQYGKNDVNVFPNPAKSYAQVNFISQKEGKTFISVINILGKTVVTQPVMLNRGSNHVIVGGLDKLSKGVYIVQVTVNESKVTRKIIIE